MAKLIWLLIKPLVFLFDAERMHFFLTTLLRILFRTGGGGAIRRISGAPDPFLPRKRYQSSRLSFQTLSPLGLAAGFDKNGEILPLLPHLGFGFAEIGTVTPHPQPGNERPRLFRNPQTQSIFNRMGFNSLGAQVVAENLRKARLMLPPGFVVGINLGKNKDTPEKFAHLDYAEAAGHFEGLADYLVVNVSSPNTPGLRKLQNLDSLSLIFDSLKEKMSTWAKIPPIFLKLAPELPHSDLESFILNEKNWNISGWVLTNTRAGEFRGSSGGWSGEPLRETSRHQLQFMRPLTNLGIISVGGIMDLGEAQLRMELGADLIQIYSGWVFSGPRFPGEISRFLRF